MMKRIILIFMAVLVVAVGGYGALHWRAETLLHRELKRHGYDKVHVNGFRYYFDGSVSDEWVFSDHVRAQDIYIKANPWQIINGHPQLLVIKKLDIRLDDLRDLPALYLPDTMAYEIEKITVTSDTPIGSIVTNGTLKQATDHTSLLKFKGKSSYLSFKGQGEIVTEGTKVKSIHLDFKNLSTERSKFSLRRTDGWVVLNHDDTWRIASEFGTGFVSFYDLGLTDATLSMMGDLSSPSVTLSGLEKEYDSNFLLEWHENDLKFHAAQTDRHASRVLETSSWNEEAAVDIARSLLEKNDARKKVIMIPPRGSGKPIREKRIAEKDKTPLSVPVDQATDASQTALVEETQTLLKKTFADIIRGSFFEGFHYTKPLSILETACVDAVEKTCWIAKSLGGSFGFDPLAVPSYLLRLKNYEQTTILKEALEKASIRSMTIQGIGESVRSMTLDGYAKDGRPIYIELSISDVN